MSRFINTELKIRFRVIRFSLDSEKVGTKLDAKLMAKLESGFDNDSDSK